MANKIKWSAEQVSKEHVFHAADILNSGRYKNFRESRFYDVIIHGRPYPPKAICSCAHELATGIALTPHDYGGSKEGVYHRRLKELGFVIVNKNLSKKFDAEVDYYIKIDQKNRADLLRNSIETLPEKYQTVVYRYNRSPVVVAERLFRARACY